MGSLRSCAEESQGVVYGFLHDYTGKWVTCQYCGRTVLYSQRTRHTKMFHTSLTGGLIIDFL
ncbi:hypothetical protein Ahae5227_09245 [Acinetobacter haemolyticus]|nr:hypothetical protein Ahae5227_09245 [Acinetobacter haemolyticus]QHI27827.1 hypothetical protein Ahae2126ch_08640 [Acinetobacter haemolyticus]